MKHTLSAVRPLGLPLLMLATVLTASCGGGTGTGPAAPAFTLTPGDGRIVVNWTGQAGLNYSIYYAAGSTVSSTSYSKHETGSGVIVNAVSPTAISSFNVVNSGIALANDSQFSATLNVRQGNSPAGPDAPVQSVFARRAGEFWTTTNSNGSDASWQALSSTAAISGRLAPSVVGSLRAVAAGPALATTRQAGYVAAGDAGVLQVSSDDGSTWRAVTPPAATNNFKAVATDNTVFVAVGCDTYAGGICTKSLVFRSGSVDLTTTTATPWVAQTLPAFATSTLNAVTASGAGMVAVGDNNTILLGTSNGSVWTSASTLPVTAGNWKSVACGGLNCVVVGNSGAAATSADGGYTWTSKTLGATDNLAGVSYGTYSTTLGGATITTALFVAVGDKGNVWRLPLTTSTDGIVSFNGSPWASTSNVFGVTPSGSLFTPTVMNSITFGSQYMAVGAGGAIYYSQDAVTWKQPANQPSTMNTTLNAIMHTPNQTNRYFEYMAVGDNATMLTAN